VKGTEREAEAALTVVCLEEMDGRTRGITVKLCADEAQAQRELDRMVLRVFFPGENQSDQQANLKARGEKNG
jgi:hypothetical protein